MSTEPSLPHTSLFSRILHFPLTRIVLGTLILGGPVLLVIQLLPHAGGAYSLPDSLHWPLVSLTVVAAGWCCYRVYVRLLEGNRPVTELSTDGGLRELGIGLAVGAGLFVSVVGTLWLCGYYRVTGLNEWTTVLPMFWSGVYSGFFEELLSRGLWFRVLEEWVGTWAALAITALLFGFAHAFNPHAGLLSSISIALSAGILLALVYVYTRRLWLAIGLHFAWNFTQGGLFGLPVSGISLGGLLQSHLEGPILLTGGAFGPEASIFTMLDVLAVSAWFLLLCRRRGDRFVAPRRRRTAL